MVDHGPKSGQVFTVVQVVHTNDTWLCLAEFDDDEAWHATRFRKIRPSAIKHIEALKDVPLHVRENEHA